MVSSNPGLFKAWLLALRPKTLSAAAAPVLVGASLVAFHPNFDRVACALAFLGAFLLQILSNFVNDLYDYLKGTDNADRIGPARTVQSGWISPSAMKMGIAVVILLNVLLGSALVWISGWPILVLGISAILSAIAYTAGPFPLGYRGLGEVFVILYFGFAAVCGTCYVCVGSIPDAAWPLAFAIGVLSSAILVVNNLRDEEGDRLSKKRTLVVRFGHRFGIAQYRLCIGLALAIPFVEVMRHRLPSTAMVVVALFPFFVGLSNRVSTAKGKEYNPLLGKTAAMLGLYGLVLACGIAFGMSRAIVIAG